MLIQYIVISKDWNSRYALITAAGCLYFNSLTADLCTLFTVIVVRGWPSDKTASLLLGAGSRVFKASTPCRYGGAMENNNTGLATGKSERSVQKVKPIRAKHFKASWRWSHVFFPTSFKVCEFQNGNGHVKSTKVWFKGRQEYNPGQGLNPQNFYKLHGRYGRDRVHLKPFSISAGSREFVVAYRFVLLLVIHGSTDNVVIELCFLPVKLSNRKLDHTQNKAFRLGPLLTVQIQ